MLVIFIFINVPLYGFKVLYQDQLPMSAAICSEHFHPEVSRHTRVSFLKVGQN